MSTIPAASTAFDEALFSFKQGLTDKEKLDFAQTTIDDVLKAAKEIQDKQGKRSLLRNLNRIKPYIAGLQQFSRVIEVFVQAKPEIMAFIWGPTKFLLQIASTYTDSFEKLVKALERIGENLPRFQLFAGVFRAHPRMQQVIVMVYQDILAFHRSTLKFFRMKSWKLVFTVLWCTFEETFGNILCDLGRHSILIDSEATAAHIAEAREARAVNLVATRKAQEDGDREDFLRLGKWLDPVDYEAIRTNFKTPCPTTGVWLIEEEDFKLWLDISNTVKRVLWLTGIPGSGKTILSSLTLEHIRLVLPTKGSALFAFLRNKNSTFQTMMRTFIFQLLSQNPQLLPYLKDISKLKFHPPTSAEELENILETMLGNVGVTYLVIDGLDEIELEERSLVLTTLLSLLSKVDNLKVFLSSRSEVDISAALKFAMREIYQVTIGDKNRSDIDTYVAEAGKEVLIKFKIDESSRGEIQEILDRVAHGAKGMFLWARLVIYNLLQQFDIEGLEDAARTLPSGLDEAYGRILKRIDVKLHPKERELARRMLEWVVSSAWPLRLKELEQAMTIRIGDRCINKRRRILRRLDELCGPILEIGVDEKVGFVHFSAKEYLVEEYSGPFIHRAVAHHNIASICITYLSFTCFDSNLSTECIINNINSGEYCLHDYAERNWLHHVRHAIKEDGKSGDSLIQLLIHFFELRRNEGALPSLLHVPSVAEFTAILENWPEVHARLVLCSAYYSGEFHGAIIKRENPLSLQKSIQHVREHIENIFTSLSMSKIDTQLQFIQSTYGTGLFKCSQFSCHYYLEGFETRNQRDGHLQRHFRPFKCDIDTCDFSSMGFASPAELDEHFRHYHLATQVEYLGETIIHSQGDQTASLNLSHVLFDAIATGNCASVHALLEKHVDINSTNEAGKTAFEYAIEAGVPEIIYLMIKNGATLGPIGEGATLRWAIEQGSIALVALVVESGADINERSSIGDTALTCAVEHAAQDEDGEIVQYLLEKGVGVNELGRDGNSALKIAVEGGHEQIVGRLLEKGADPNTLMSFGYTALMKAAKAGAQQVVQLLLEKGADPNASMPDGRTPLMMAEAGAQQVVQLLLEKGADPNASSSGGHTVLMKVMEAGVGVGAEQVIQLLLENGADPNASTSDGRTELMTAAEAGSQQVVRLLLEKGADPNASTPYGHTALMMAAGAGSQQVVRLLLEKGAEPNASTSYGHTALMMAAGAGSQHVVQLLLEKGADPNASTSDGRTALMAAAVAGSQQVVQLLLEKGADPNASTSDGRTALMAGGAGSQQVVQLLLEKGADPNASSSDGHTVLTKAAGAGDQQVVQLLLEKGADPNALMSDGRTALMAAAVAGSQQVVQLLLEKGADPNASTSDGRTALMAGGAGSQQVVRLLLEKGADPNASSSDGHTVLTKAAGAGDQQVVQLLLEKGADPNALMSDGRTALMVAAEAGYQLVVQLLLKKGADPNASMPDGHTALMKAAAGAGSPQVVQLLLEKGADPNASTSNGHTVLMKVMGARAGAGAEQVIQLLLEKGADPNASMPNGHTALMKAAAGAGSRQVVQLLLEKGADPNASMPDGHTALMMAAREGAGAGSRQVVQLLLEKGADPNASSADGHTVLMRAAMAVAVAGSGPRAESKLVVQLLLEKGADPNASTFNGHTVLMKVMGATAGAGAEQVIQLLLENGADPDVSIFIQVNTARRKRIMRIITQAAATKVSINSGEIE